jgi:glucosamine--fructose-6-phosphate aminotransferase (isomerizing)
MCGVIGVLRRRATRPDPDGAAQLAGLDRAVAALALGVAGLPAATREIAGVDCALRGSPGAALLVGDQPLRAELAARAATLDAAVTALEAALDAGTLDLAGQPLEEVNAALIACKDGVWAIGRDRLGTAAAVAALLGTGGGRPAVDAYLSVQVALSALDRLEVRGRDSAGVHVLVTGHGLDLSDPALAPRLADPLFTSGGRPGAGGAPRGV